MSVYRPILIIFFLISLFYFLDRQHTQYQSNSAAILLGATMVSLAIALRETEPRNSKSDS